MSDSAITRTFTDLRARGATALVPYLTAGYPDPRASGEALRIADELADVLEVGVPFSDPLADGPTIQRSTFQALQQGMTLAGTLELIERCRLQRPVVVFSYLNPILRYGLDRFLADAQGIGFAGLLLTDLPAASRSGRVVGAISRIRSSALRWTASSTAGSLPAGRSVSSRPAMPMP